MTDEQMRIAIAEACGWHEEKEPVGSAFATAWWHHNDRYPSYLMPLPDYLNDLNAMHEAEKVLLKDGHESDLWLEYLSNLVICAPAGLSSHATARQRAEAFLKTKGILP